MSLPTSELLFALRRPQAHWLVAFVATLNEALQDPSFDHEQRNLICQLLQAGKVPEMVAAAAQRGFANLAYNDDVNADTASAVDPMAGYMEQPSRRSAMFLADI